MDEMFAEMVSTATIAIALFGVMFSLVQKRHLSVHRSFAAFLLAVAVANVPDAFHRLFEAVPDNRGTLFSLFLWLASALCLAPLFWIYVCTLTSTTQRPPRRLLLHFVLAALCCVAGGVTALAPDGVGAALVSEDAGVWPTSDGALVILLFVAIVLVLAQVVIYPQMAIYLFLIGRRMMRYRLVLRDYYASTEQHELRWIYVITGLAWLYWLAQLVLFLLTLDGEMADVSPVLLGVAGLASLSVVAAMTLWGLRQNPPLVPPQVDGGVAVPADPGPINPGPIKTGPAKATHTGTLPAQDRSEKYEKSALSPEASTRIAHKLRAAMERDHLHRDPNLSLWALARHVGASPNYISQTLSEVIGESFFDFVNGYRIAEAKTLLSTTEDTVLAITYEVGFNARSSFYNAFKRVTGQTPTNYRKTLSVPVGLDDAGAELRDT